MQYAAEGDRVLAGRLPTSADLPDLPYTLQVFKETLRCIRRYMPSPGVRSAGAARRLPYSQRSSVVISPYTLQRRADPLCRAGTLQSRAFALQQESQLARYAYLPLALDRHLSGHAFALLEGQLNPRGPS